MVNFNGVKIALFFNDKILVYQRDDKAGLRWANLWDFPGGGRENGETPFECVRREVYEEFGIALNESQIKWRKVVPAMHDPNQDAIFMVGNLSESNIRNISFGSEGQRWELWKISEFLSSNLVVPKLNDRLKLYLDESATRELTD